MNYGGSLQDAGRAVGRAGDGGVDGIIKSSFSPDARNYVAGIEKKIVLVDGEALAGLMSEHGVGVTEVTRYEIKRLDRDYFGSEP
jgi:restriction system protein